MATIDKPPLNEPDDAKQQSSFDDPEMSFRRGFEQGAWFLFTYLERYLPPAIGSEAMSWIQHDIHDWRLANMRGETGRKDGRLDHTLVAPPTPDKRKQ